ncbi:hypothetical protein FHL15_006090 [Xylaria flabelliformis]|uniref:NB-ARC domain-containing protein n=1 Tax=Xylaria flabelliformis TaxID=2512241 RepID=A0A553HYD0_9PEZI|nr:hypothetical protein FHL15_006090 [Xylaria flabelliformis]
MPLTDDQFIELLKGFADADRFSHHETPTTFIVYAHENEEHGKGKAHADFVHCVIRWLTAIQSRTVSDKVPLLCSPNNGQSDPSPTHNIIDNQFRLLPLSGPNSVDKVVVFGSEVLRQYRQHSFTSQYINELRARYEAVKSAGLEKCKSEIRRFVEAKCREVGFHHVLTELAFLQIRKDDSKNHGIIPVDLSGDNIEYLEFVERCDVFLKNTNKEAYKLFFQLLGRIYDNDKDHATIRVIQDLCKELQEKDDISAKDILGHVMKGLRLLGEDAARRVRYEDRRNQGDTPRHFMVPFGRNESFVGRENIMEQLLKRIPPAATKDNCQRTAIRGLGGVGKTHIAIEVAYRVRDEHPDCSIYWVPAIDMINFENAYREIGQKLGTKGIDDDKADVKLLVKQSLSQSVGSWLLIIDNADDKDILLAGVKLINHLPFSREGSILFTTRYDDVAVRLQVPRKDIITVHEMSNDEATILLYNNLQESQKQDSESTTRLLMLLVNLPLAIKQASAYLASNMDVTVSDYLDQCESNDAGLFDMLTKDFEDSSRYSDPKVRNSIATTWLISFHHITKHNSQAADYLKFISLLAEKDIPRSLLPESNPIKMKEALSTLKAYAFIAERNDPDAFDMHRLVRLVMRNWLHQNEEWGKWTKKVVRRLNEKYPNPDHKNIQTWTKYLPHGQAVLNIDGATDIDNTILVFRTAESYSFLGKFSAGEKLYRHTLEQTKNMPGRDYPTARILNNLAVILSNQGRYEEAEEVCRQALELSKEVLGIKHPETLVFMNNLAGIFAKTPEKQGEAEEVCRQALELNKEVLGIKHPNTLFSMDSLARILTETPEKLGEAEEVCRQALELNKEMLGIKHPNTLAYMNSLARILTETPEKLGEAEELCRQTLELRKEVLGIKHPSTLASMNNLGNILTKTPEKQGEAEELCRQTLELRKEVLGIKHPSTLASMNNLGNILTKTPEKQGEAEEVCRQALELRKEMLGIKHPDTLISMNNLAVNLSNQWRHKEAEEMYQPILNLREEMLGRKHPDTLISMNNLAVNLHDQGRHKEAEEMYQQILNLKEEVLGRKHPDTLNTARLLDCILRKQAKSQSSMDGS